MRLAIGWHFYKEGLSHHVDPAWSSEGFLKQAKGPLADAYHSVLPDLHGWNRLMLAPLGEGQAATHDEKSEDGGGEKAVTVEPDSKGRFVVELDGKKAAADKSAPISPPAYEAWFKAALADWKADVDRATEAYHFDDKQKERADAILADAKRRLKDDLEEHEADIRLYRQLVARAQGMSAGPGAQEIPNEAARSAAAQQNPLGERGLNGQSSPLSSPPAAWQASAQSIDQFFHDQLRGLLTADRLAMPAPATNASRLHDIDTGIGWLLMIVGGLLIVGLFTRVAAVVGALFLLSIICAQPPWLATSVQTYTYNQWVEMLALLALATTPVGRWGGLDFFLSLCCRSCCGSKAKTTDDPPKPNLPPGVNMPPSMQKRMS